MNKNLAKRKINIFNALKKQIHKQEIDSLSELSAKLQDVKELNTKIRNNLISCSRLKEKLTSNTSRVHSRPSDACKLYNFFEYSDSCNLLIDESSFYRGNLKQNLKTKNADCSHVVQGISKLRKKKTIVENKLSQVLKQFHAVSIVEDLEEIDGKLQNRIKG